MRWSISRSESPFQYAPATFMSLNAPILPAEGMCGPLHKSTKSPWRRMMISSSAGSSRTCSSLKRWSAKICSASSRETTSRTNGSSRAMISAILASMASKSSGVMERGSSKS